MRVYLDNCCFNRPFDDQSQLRIRLETEAKLSIQQKVNKGDIELAWSYILDFENKANPFEERQEVVNSWKMRATIDVGETVEILNLAQEIQRHGLQSKDCLHLACAIASKCDIYFSTDDHILRKQNQISLIRILNPVEFITKEYQ